MHNTGNKRKKFVALFLCIMMMVCNTVFTYAETENLTGSGQTVAYEQEYVDELTSDGRIYEGAVSGCPEEESRGLLQ